MLVKLIAAMSGTACDFAVVSLLDAGTQGAPLRELRVPVAELRLKQPWRLPALPLLLRQMVREFEPDVIQGWMYHGNLAATIARGLAGSTARLFWGVRQTLYGMKLERPLTRLVIRANAALSSSPEAVIFNSGLSLRQHCAAGFAEDRSIVIPNGFDTALFRADAAARSSTRGRLDIPERAEVVGLVARDHPMKDHATFFRAAEAVARLRRDAYFLLAGPGIETANERIAALVAAAGVGQRVRLLGEVGGVEQLLPAFDVAVLSSAWGEAFPNVLGEAMACGVPCVSTDVGDAREIIGDAGRIVPAANSERLAAAVVEVLSLGRDGRRALGEAGRRRVEAMFSLDAVAGQYLELYTAGQSVHR